MTTHGIFTPVIMAGGEHREMWPLSRVDLPVQFRRDANGTSPFLAWLAFFADVDCAGPPTVVANANAAAVAREQITEAAAPARLIVLPAARGIRPAICMAAMLHDERERLVFADAPTPPRETLAFRNVLLELAAAHAAAGGTVLSALPVTAGADVRRGDRCENGLIRPAGTATEPQHGGYRIGPLWTGTGREIAEGVAAADAEIAQVCRQLASTGEPTGNETWIGNTRCSQLDGNPRRLAMLATLGNAKLRPVALHADGDGRPVMRTNATDGDVRTIASRNCDVRSREHLAVVIGCENLRVLATPDATLVTRMGEEAAIEDFVREIWLAERPEAFAQGVERRRAGELFRSPDGLRLVEVAPAGTFATRAGDRGESWTVVRGAARLFTAGHECDAPTGTTLHVAPGGAVVCENAGEDSVVVVATTSRPIDAPPMQHDALRRDTPQRHTSQPPQGQPDQQRKAEPLVEGLQPG